MSQKVYNPHDFISKRIQAGNESVVPWRGICYVSVSFRKEIVSLVSKDPDANGKYENIEVEGIHYYPHKYNSLPLIGIENIAKMLNISCSADRETRKLLVGGTTDMCNDLMKMFGEFESDSSAGPATGYRKVVEKCDDHMKIMKLLRKNNKLKTEILLLNFYYERELLVEKLADQCITYWTKQKNEIGLRYLKDYFSTQELPKLTVLFKCENCKRVPKKGEEFKQCGSCKNVYFCSRDCQVQSWKKDHRFICRFLKKRAYRTISYDDMDFSIYLGNSDYDQQIIKLLISLQKKKNL